MKTTLIIFGVTVGSTIVFDDDSEEATPGFPPSILPGSGMAITPGVSVVGSWVANNVTFYRLSNGYIAVQNMKGRWKVWKPKRPIVLMPSGAGDLRTLLKADRVTHRQLKRLDKAIRRRKNK